ncbi:hypothetical protein BHE74_00040093, partial [Ensete ventricosum]
ARLQKPFNKLANDTRILLLAESTLRSLRLSHQRPEATGGSGSIYRRWKVNLLLLLRLLFLLLFAIFPACPSSPSPGRLPKSFVAALAAPETSSLISEAEMRWLKKWLASPIKSTRGITAFGLLTRRAPQEIMNGKLHHTSYSLTAILQQFGSGSANVLGNASNPQFDNKRPQTVLHARLIGCRWFSDSAGKERTLNRDWLARLWVEEKRNMEVRRRGRRKRQPAPRVQDRGTLFDTFSSQLPFLKSVLRKPALAEQDSGIKETMQQPPISQYDGDLLTPGSPEEVSSCAQFILANLLITRDIEWANIMFAFEQPVGFIRESSNVIFRQVRDLRTVEVGVVHRRWHLWRRIYDLYLG